ncbi:conserved hypothetical protein [Streptomyces sviceus ATCC 29083]|uniref:Uncharacterized protein n=1 Tax=Streptomyces sviceus (strain ATCC 29083 / DSM 924 / JCM 4929 / NBRC 13980 / NCIMB 11184 / NRRL 5439 / UC 5370) TaxID=463191 RepID=B5I513_STRX2|nr:hypothetical protein [Streptomyces sp. SID5470]EDY60168.1 conserved hypothetical protein [Streptomyces sviceus ATCC 29083]
MTLHAHARDVTTTERSGPVTADPEHPVVHGELAELRRRLDVAYARVEGGLALLSHRTEETDKEIDDLSARIIALEHARWPLPAISAITAAGALVVAIWQALGR